MTRQEMLTQIETMIDATSLEDVISVVAEVCGEKADHLVTNWQDGGAGQAWNKAQRILDQASRKVVGL